MLLTGILAILVSGLFTWLELYSPSIFFGLLGFLIIMLHVQEMLRDYWEERKEIEPR